jgi:hypothetical protein
MGPPRLQQHGVYRRRRWGFHPGASAIPLFSGRYEVARYCLVQACALTVQMRPASRSYLVPNVLAKRDSKNSRLCASSGWPGECNTSCTMAGAWALAAMGAPADLVWIGFRSSSSHAAHLRLSCCPGAAELETATVFCITWSAARSASCSSGSPS